MSNDRRNGSGYDRMPERPVTFNERDYDGYTNYDAPRKQSRPAQRSGSRRPGPSGNQYRSEVRGYENNRPQYDSRDVQRSRARQAERPRREAAPRRDDRSYRDSGRGRDPRYDRPQYAPQHMGRSSGGKKERRKKKKNPFVSFIKTLFVIAIILCAIALGLSYVMTLKAYNLMKYETVGDADKEALTDDGVTNILLIGNDSRLNGEDGRSDAMILVSISKTSGKILMTSFLRDMYVEIPGYGHNRLNAAYSWGGAELLMETIEKNFDIPVNRYILVNFEAFANVVDAVGGVDLDLSTDETIWVNAYLNEYNELRGMEFGYDYIMDLEPGVKHLNGAQALAYSRIRYIGTDFGRTERQRKVMEELIKKLPMAVLTNSSGLMEGLCPNLTTNLTFNECYGLVLRLPFIFGYDRVSGSIPLEGTWYDQNVDGMAVLGVDFEANENYLYQNLYVKPEKPVGEETEES